VATPLSNCKKFSMVRSAVSKAGAGPLISSTTWLGVATLPFGHLPGQLDRGVHLGECRLRPGGTANHRIFTGNDGGTGTPRGVHQACSQISRTHVFGQSTRCIGLRQGHNRRWGELEKIRHEVLLL
jgi:hypothetical protein